MQNNNETLKRVIINGKNFIVKCSMIIGKGTLVEKINGKVNFYALINEKESLYEVLFSMPADLLDLYYNKRFELENRISRDLVPNSVLLQTGEEIDLG